MDKRDATALPEAHLTTLEEPETPHAALVSASWLAARLGDPSVKVAQLLYEPDVDDYSDGHLPGAHAWHWKEMLWHPTDREFPTPSLMAGRLAAAGIGPDDTLVLYSGRNQYAMYGYWVIKAMCGHRDVRVLDGAKRRWTQEGLPLTEGVPRPAPVRYAPSRSERDDSSRVSREEVLASLRSPDVAIVDARTPEEYRGQRVKPGPGFDHGAERYGHIPGARNLHARDLFDPTDFRLKPRSQLEAMFRAAAADPEQAERVIAYCRLSHRASAIWFTATQVLNWHHVRVYDGSWTEWGSSVGLPIEK